MLTKLFRMATLEDPTTPLTGKNIAEALTDRRTAKSGELVGTGDALTCSPVWSALDQITSDIARLPWRPYCDKPEGREMLRKHPLYQICAKSVDGGTTTTNIWIRRMVAHALLYGNAYAQIHWVKAGGKLVVKSIEWIHSDKVQLRRENGQSFFDVTWNPFEDGAKKSMTEWVPPENMFHLQGLTIGWLGGLSLVHYARNTIGRQLAASAYGDEFYANSAIPQGFFSHPGNLSEPAQNRFIAQMERRFSGSGNRHRLGFLEEDMKWVATGISPKDAQLVDAMKWGIPEVARFFSIPAHKLGDPSRQGWNTTEQENQSYYNSTLGKWTSGMACESHKLFDTSEQDTCYTTFDTDELLRADTQARYTAYGIGIQWGFLTRNDVRKKENLPPLEGLDEPLTPVNMAVGQVPSFQDPAPAAPPVDDSNDAGAEDTPADDEEDIAEANSQRMRFAQRDVVADQLQRMTKRVTRAAAKAAKEPRAFLSWLNEMDSEHGAAIREALTPAAGLVGALRDTRADQVLEQLATEFIATARDELLASSEVQPSQLQDSVAAASERLLVWCRDAATTWTTPPKGAIQ